MPRAKPLSNSALAAHWGCSPRYVRKIALGKTMPAFFSVAEADAWRSIHAPPKSQTAQTRTATTPAEPPQARGRGDVVDVKQFVQRDRDFESLMIEQAEEKPQIASGLFDLACERGNFAEISAANKNWHECAKAAAAVKKDFLAVQEQSRALLPLDEVMDLLGLELQPFDHDFQKMGERICIAANPDNPALAKKVIEDYCAKLRTQIARIKANVATELAAPPSTEDPVT